MVTTAEIDQIIGSLENALAAARRARRVQLELEWDPQEQLRQVRTSALGAVRTIADHYPPERKPARV